MATFLAIVTGLTVIGLLAIAVGKGIHKIENEPEEKTKVIAANQSVITPKEDFVC